jgi:hypothetical protein
MPSDKPSLGKFVSLRNRADGTHRVLFEIPKRLRPSGWSATIPLPLKGERTGDITNAQEVARIRDDAGRLYGEYLATKTGGGAVAEAAAAHDFKALVRAWQTSQAWKDNKPRTNKGYQYYIRIIMAWSESLGNPRPETITVPDVEQLIGIYDDRTTDRYHLRKVLRMIMQQAVRMEWRATNPVDHVKVKMPKTKVEIWEKDDVEAHVQAAQAAGLPDLAALIQTEWEIGQRLTDVVLFRHDADYSNGEFRFDQSKTDQPVVVTATPRLQTMITACRRTDSIYLFHDAATGRPFRDVDRLWHVFDTARPKTGRRLVPRVLRHSAIVDMGRHGCTVPEIASISGHSLSSVYKILQTYMPRDSQMAANAQRKRGL